MSEPTIQKRSRKEKVVWTAHELQAVIEEAVLVSVQDTEYLWTHLAKAQIQALPPDRHRRIAGKHVVNKEILELFIEARGEFLDHKERVGEPIEVPAPTPTPAPDRTAIIASLTNGEIFELVLQRFEPLLAGIRAFAEIAKAHASSPERPGVPGMEASPAPAPATALPATKPGARVPGKTTKVLLFGFDQAQEFEIRGKAGSFDLELLFISQPPGKPLPTIPPCDWCIVKRNPPLTRRAADGLRKRPGVGKLMDANTADTALQKLNDINSRRS